MSSVPNLLHKVFVIATVATAFSLSIVWFFWNIWLLRLPQFSFHALFNYECYYSLGLVVIVIAIAFWLKKPKGARFTIRRMLATVLLLCLVLQADACVRERYSLRLCFWSSQSPLDEFADQLYKAQQDDPTDVRIVDRKIGNYRIVSAYIVNEAVILRLDDRGEEFIGRYAFVRIPGCDGGDIDMERYGFPRGYSMVMHLSGEWFVFYDAYNSLKTGWS